MPPAAVMTKPAEAPAASAAGSPAGTEEVRVGGLVLGHVRQIRRTGRSRTPQTLAERRWNEVRRFLRFAFGVRGVRTDDAEWLLAPVAASAAWAAEVKAERIGRPVDFPELTRLTAEAVRTWFPLLTAAEVGAAALEAAGPDRPRYSADTLARELCITFELRQRLGIRSIGCCDLPRRTRVRLIREAKAARDREVKAAQRAKAGARPRLESLAALARALGVSRPTVYEWRRRGVLAEKCAAAGVVYTFGAHKRDPTGAETVKSAPGASESVIPDSGLTRPSGRGEGGGIKPPPPSHSDQQQGGLTALRIVAAGVGGRPQTVVRDLLAATVFALRQSGAGASRARPPTSSSATTPTTPPPARSARG